MSTYVRPYDRKMRHWILVEGSGKACDALYDVVESMSAITNMVRALLVEGEDRRDMAEGVFKLLDQQCAMLGGIVAELEDEDQERVALNEAKGIVSHRMLPDENLNDEQHKLRVQFIESNTKAGIHPRVIGGALNLTEDYVGRVVARLRGEPAPAPAPAAKAAARRAGAN